jgi:ribosomal protein S12 methylthiotransferase accessory factor
MLENLTKEYISGTHRLVPPEKTLERIQPHLARIGITRCADVTGLDRLSIPVYCAIRPQGLVLQVSNGKGLGHTNAKVSALMEAIEIYHAEHPDPAKLRRTSLAKLRGEGNSVISPAQLPEYLSECYFSEDFAIDWTCGEDLQTGEAIWLPASAVYLCEPSLHSFSANGLASGNHPMEATLHGLYEAIERDALSRLSSNGRLQISDYCQVVDLDRVDDPFVQQLYQTLEQAGVKLVLLWVPSCIAVNTFWAVILDPNPFSASSAVNIGYGTHLSPAVAAIRAITEAAQSRLTFIHGGREDMKELSYQESNLKQRTFKFFDRLAADTDWQQFTDRSGASLQQDYARVLNSLSLAGYDRIWRVELTRAPFNIPVVKVIVPGLQFNHHFF